MVSHLCHLKTEEDIYTKSVHQCVLMCFCVFSGSEEAEPEVPEGFRVNFTPQ